VPAANHAGVYLGELWRPAYGSVAGHGDRNGQRALATTHAVGARPLDCLECVKAGPLVEDRAGDPVATWRFRELMSLLLIAQTGAGKTTLLRVVIDQLDKDPTEKVLMLCDGKEVGSFYLFASKPGVRFCNDKDGIVEVVAGVAGEVAQRKKRLARARQEAVRRQARVDGWQPFVEIFLVIDDYMGWLLLLNDKEVIKEVLADLSVIAFQGREVKIHLILAMQTAHSKILDVGLSPQLKLNMDAKVVVPGDKGLAAVQAGMLFDDRSAAERIPAVKGGGLYRVGRAEVQFTVPNFPDPSDPETELPDEEVERLFALIAA
jgi:energy-coupling factor transporter ATP-binding protein EcfA2